MIYFIISYILNDTVHIPGPFCVIFKTFCLIVINYFILTDFFFCGFVINRILPYPAKPSYSHCVKLGRTDDHFSTAARVKKTVTLPTDKTVTVLALVS